METPFEITSELTTYPIYSLSTVPVYKIRVFCIKDV